MSRDELAASDAGYADWWRVWAESVEGGEAREMDGVLVAATGAPQEWWNCAFVTRPLAEPEAALRRAVAFFDERRQPFIARIRDGVDPASERVAEALGMHYTDSVPGMVLRPILEGAAGAEGLEIRTVSDDPSLEDHARVIAGGFEMDVDLVRRLVTKRLIEHSRWWSYVGYVDGEATTTAALLATDEVANVNFVATREAFRRRGWGEAITWHAAREGAKAGCVLASLQASEMGRPVYERMGFRHVTGYKTFVRPEHRS